MFVVFDSNIWISQRGLKSVAAEEVKKFIKAKGATLVVPEVVKIEVERNIREELIKHRKTIEDAHNAIAKLFGNVDELSLPSDDQIDHLVSRLVEDTGVQIRHMPLTFEGAKSSFEKILRKEPPSAKNEQFKDGVIWANCLELLKESDVYLVSEDSAFFKENKYEFGLAPNLDQEAKKHLPKRLKLFFNLKGLLQDERQDVTRVLPDTESNEFEHKRNDQGAT